MPTAVDEKDAILREAKAALETVEKANPQLTGGGDEAARHSNEPVIVDEDHGVQIDAQQF